MGAALACESHCRITYDNPHFDNHVPNMVFLVLHNPGVESMAYRLAAITILASIAAITRETSAFLIGLSVLVAYPRQWRWWLPLAVWLMALLLILRLAIQAQPCCWPVDIWTANMQSTHVWAAVRQLGLLLPILLLSLFAIYRSPHALKRRIVLVLIPYLILVALFGAWRETRLLMPVFILAIPALNGLSGF